MANGTSLEAIYEKLIGMDKKLDELDKKIDDNDERTTSCLAAIAMNILEIKQDIKTLSAEEEIGV